MSKTSTALVFFGWQLTEWASDRHSLNDLWLDEHGPRRPEDASNYRTPAWDEWRDKMRAFKETPEHVEIDWCGCELYLRHFVHCPCFVASVDWGIAELHLPREVGDAQKWLEAFCDRFGLPKNKATWHLGARYF